jgi:hypothetical protein
LFLPLTSLGPASHTGLVRTSPAAEYSFKTTVSNGIWITAGLRASSARSIDGVGFAIKE